MIDSPIGFYKMDGSLELAIVFHKKNSMWLPICICISNERKILWNIQLNRCWWWTYASSIGGRRFSSTTTTSGRECLLNIEEHWQFHSLNYTRWKKYPLVDDENQSSKKYVVFDKKTYSSKSTCFLLSFSLEHSIFHHIF